MIEVLETTGFVRWFENLTDEMARARILARIRRLSLGNSGDAAAVGEGVMELRLHFGPGYRVYFIPLGKSRVVLLTGGTKDTQTRDIQRAIELRREIEVD